jgi:hypothetical protein
MGPMSTDRLEESKSVRDDDDLAGGPSRIWQNYGRQEACKGTAFPAPESDEWMIPLFGQPESDGKRDVLEGRMIILALQLLRLNTNVVLDFGCWAREERAALQWLAEREETTFRLVYLPVDRVTQLERIERRRTDAPHQTFAITSVDLDRWRAMFDVPDDAELAGSPPPTPPSFWSS